jgi:hypothetical protein
VATWDEAGESRLPPRLSRIATAARFYRGTRFGVTDPCGEGRESPSVGATVTAATHKADVGSARSCLRRPGSRCEA